MPLRTSEIKVKHKQRGLPTKLRNIFLWKQWSYILALLVIWIANLMHNSAEKFKRVFQADTDQRYLEINSYSDYVYMIGLLAAISSGLILSIIRLSDPFYRHIISSAFKEYFGIRSDINYTDQQKNYTKITSNFKPKRNKKSLEIQC